MVIPILLSIYSSLLTPISVDVEVGNAGKAVKALSLASKVPMRATGDAAKETVFLHVRQLPVQQVMDSLARVTHATWSRNRDGLYVLTRSEATTRALIASIEREKQAQKLRVLTKWRDRLLRCLTIPYDENSLNHIVLEKSELESLDETEESSAKREIQTARSEELERADPTYRALARTLTHISLNRLAQMPDDSYAVYSSKPIGNELPIGGDAEGICRYLQPEQVAWGKALAKKPLAKGEDPKARFSTDETVTFFRNAYLLASTKPWQRTLPYKKTPSIVTLAILYRQGYYDFDLTLSSSDGLPVMEFEGAQASTVADSDDRQAKLDGVSLIRPTPSRETQDFWARTEHDGDNPKPTSPRLHRFLVDPVNNDPLWLGNQELLTALAVTSKKSIVACLPDSAYCLKHRFSLIDYAPNREMESIEADGTLEFRPSNFRQHWLQRIDRTQMAVCAQDFLTKGRIDLRHYVAMVAHMPRDPVFNFGTSFVGMIDPRYSTDYSLFRLPSRPTFTLLLNSLTGKQLDRIRRGEIIPYRELDPIQQTYASRIVFGSILNQENEGGGQTYATRELPKGLFQGTGLKGEVCIAEYVVFHNGRKDGSDTYFSMNLSIPDWRYPISGPSPRLPEGGFDKTTYTLHRVQFIRLRCGLAPGHFISGRFEGPMSPPLGRAVRFSDLPISVQRKLKGAVDYLTRRGR